MRDYRLKDIIKTSEIEFPELLKSTDVYDPDRIEADRDLLRRFYLKHGFADVRDRSATSEFDPAVEAFVVTFTIEEGDQYSSAPSTFSRTFARSMPQARYGQA